jgi:DNA modification methylase
VLMMNKSLGVYSKKGATIYVGDAAETLKTLDAGSARTCVTSPPYWGLRDYGQEAQLGVEGSPEAFIENLCLVFDEVWRVLADDGTLWVNIGDSYGKTAMGDVKVKDLVGIPWMFAFAMRARGWYLRQDIIWSKPNPMPESVKDRCTKSHEYIFLFSKQPSYYYDHEAIKEPAIYPDASGPRFGGSKYGDSNDIKHATKSGNVYESSGTKNKRSVWTVPPARYKEAHFAVYPPALIVPCVLAGSAPGDTVLDPFSGSGTTGEVALLNDRNYVGIELNPDYAALSEKRISDAIGMFGRIELL